MTSLPRNVNASATDNDINLILNFVGASGVASSASSSSRSNVTPRGKVMLGIQQTAVEEDDDSEEEVEKMALEITDQLKTASVSDSDSDSDSDSSRSPSPVPLTRGTLGNQSNNHTSKNKDGAKSDDDDDDDEGVAAGTSSSYFNTKNQIELPPSLPPMIEVNEDDELEPLGEIKNIVGPTVIVEGYQHGHYQVLDTDSLLVFEDRKVLGLVYEAFGPVRKPFYVVRFPSIADIDTNSVHLQKKVFHVVKRSSYLFTNALRQHKGSDASNVFDEEVGEDEQEYSDDEEEAAHRRELTERRINQHKREPDSDVESQRRLSDAPVGLSLQAKEDADIFYGAAYDDPPSASVSRAMPSRPLPTAYDEISPYDDAPLPYDDVLIPSTSTVEMEIKPDEMPLHPSSPKPHERGDPSRRGSSRGKRGRGGSRGGLSSPTSTSSSRGRGRGGQQRERGNRGRGRGSTNHGRNDSASSRLTTDASSSTPVPLSSPTALVEEYDPRNPELPRPLSPTSLAIARATGDWGAASSFNSSFPSDPSFSTHGYDGYSFQTPATQAPYGQTGVQPFVSPHINPRFAPHFNYQLLFQQQQMQQLQMQQQQMFWGQQQQPQHGNEYQYGMVQSDYGSEPYSLNAGDTILDANFSNSRGTEPENKSEGTSMGGDLDNT